jgi:sacsin
MDYRKGHRKSGVRIKLSKLKGIYPNQLAPFEGIGGYSRNQDYYQGTIFRFPLRPATTQSILRESNTPLDYTATQRFMEDFITEARISLLFLRNVRSMQFKIHGETHPRWLVQSTHEGLEDNFCQWLDCTLSNGNGSCYDATTKDRWRRAVQGRLDFPGDLPRRHKRTMKDVECGMAALVSSRSSNKVGKVSATPKPKFFNVLPLPFQSNLPVHVHASFLTTGDRQSIPIEESATDIGADWNRWLLTSAVPLLYLEFLEDLASELGRKVFDWWPVQDPPKDSLTCLTYSSFWRQLPSSSRLLFPLVRQLDSKRCQALNHVEIKEAVFDVLPNDISQILQRMLQRLIPRLVRVPFAIKKRLQSLEPKVTSITPRMLREIFRSNAAAEYLANSKPSTKVLDVLLKEMMPKSNADYEELDGCRALPLADGTFGMLNLVDPHKPTITYYMVTKSEMELFDFASELLTLEEEGGDFKTALFNYREKFNIKRLELSDVGTLLAKKTFQTDASTSENDDWLLHFWKFWKQKEVFSEDLSKTLFMSASGLRNYPILQASRDGAKAYLRPSEFESLPSVVGPADEHHQKLCDTIPGLYILNSKYMPVYLGAAEASLNNAPSFARLVKGMSMLAAKKEGGLESFINSIFGDVELEA